MRNIDSDGDEKEDRRIIVDTVPEMRNYRMIFACDQSVLNSYLTSGMSSVELACVEWLEGV